MSDTSRTTSRKTTLIFGVLALLALVVLGGIISVRGCHGPNTMEDRIDPDEQLPGTLEGTGSLYTPDATPLLQAS